MLEAVPNTRNHDGELWAYVCNHFFPDSFRTIDGERWVRVKDVAYNLPSQDNIKRIRAQFQNDDGLFPPTDPQVVLKRQRNEKEWESHINREYV